MLIDGHSLAYRAFFALPLTLSTTGGQPTNAVYGFTSMLFKALEDERPDAVVVAFDGPRSELKRTEVFAEYKAHRPSMPEELRPQIEMIENLLEALRIPAVRAAGHEADDVLGTLALKAASGGDSAVIVTGDRDALQLVRDGVTVMLTGKGITETTTFDEKAVMEKYGVPPGKIPDVVGLKGDSSDNIPGVPGIGEKGASALMAEYGSLEALYDRLDEITAKKRKQSLEDNRDIAFLSRDLAVIETGLDLEVDLNAISVGDWDAGEVVDHLSSLEFRTLARRFTETFPPEAGERAPGLEVRVALVDPDDAARVKEFVKKAEEECEMGLSVSAIGGSWCDIAVEAVALAAGDDAMVVHPGSPSPGLDAARDLLASGCLKYMHDGKRGALALEKSGLALASFSFDTALAAYLENPSLGSYNIEDVWGRNASIDIEVEGAGAAGGELTLFEDAGAQDGRLALEAARVLHLKPVMDAKLDDLSMTSLFLEIEMPVAGVLASLEKEGVALDTEVATRLSAEAHQKLDSLERGIFDIAGHEFKIGSTRQLAEVLFNELGLPPLKRTKTGYSTDSSVLESLAAEHEIAGLLLEYREYSKLASTYFDVLPALVCPDDGRVHGTFNQMATSTGRISSSNPNLQNIPVRTEIGRRIRAAFVARPGWKLLVADYSQIELRVLAHVSSDPLLLQAFARDEDVHADTAAKLYGVEEADVTPEMRRVAKMVNFGVVYGMSEFGLASRLGIPRDEAAGFIEKYFDRYAGVRSYRDSCIRETAARGYTETLFGRRRYVPQLRSDNRQTREFGERLAVNTPLQGTAADIIKKAMVDADRTLRSEGMLTAMTLQIHDELIFEVPPGEEDAAASLAEKCMSSACDMKVPLKVDLGLYDNWGEAKS